VLTQDSEEALNRAQDRPVDDDGAFEAGLERHLVPGEWVLVVLICGELLRSELLLNDSIFVGGVMRLLLSGVLVLVLKVEANGLLEVDLDSTTLVLSAKRIIDLDVDLGAVERAITVVVSPGLAEAVKSVFEGTLSHVPLFLGAEFVIGSGRKLELVGEAEDTVDMLEEVQTVLDLGSDLLRSAENMSIILLESANANQTTKSARDLITVKDTEISVAEGKITVAVDAVLEHDAMSGAVHRLEALRIAGFAIEQEHVILVVLIMTASFPKLQVVNVGRDDLREAANAVLFPDHVHKLVVNHGALRVEESTARGRIEVVEEVLLTTNDTMIALLGLLTEVDVLLELLLSRERDSVDALQTVVCGLSEPVRCRVTHDLETLDELGGGDMGACAQIDQVTALVDRDTLAILDLAGDSRNLEGVGLKHRQGLFFGKYETRELLVIAADFLRHFLDC